ncbi:hypothetical protein [Streptomyces sp. NPDC060194]|uniref:hypothetical protein n=1 Tax=Streptomyces sp. NPDC060194 TaxID=3347069 RepID=UPI0036567937
MAGKLMEFTGVVWQDLLLNALTAAAAYGVIVWFIWWRREWKYGNEGAVKRYKGDEQRNDGLRARSRWIMAAVSIPAALILAGYGLVLWLGTSGKASGGGLLALVLAGVLLLAWPVLLRFARPGIPRPARAPHDGGRVAREKVKAREREEKLREEGRKAVASLRPLPGTPGRPRER